MPARITILPAETIGVIHPNLYGHFAEHLGCCINDGLWVGEDSSIPHIAGWRLDLIEAFRAIAPPILRWPGGCFADDYHWRDGIGPPQHRPKTVNLWWGQSIEDNRVGTHEFINLCRLIGAQPYLAGNVGSGSPREMRDWVEYCNFDRPSTLAMLRAANGSPMPFGVKYWGVGNEAWGCGGNFCAEDYAREYRRYATYLRDLGGTQLFLIACGPDGNNSDWTRRFLTRLATADRRFNCRLHALAAHYYCGTVGTATEYTPDQWYELLARAADIQSLITDQRRTMDEFDPDRRIGLIIDEWGTWHPPTPGRNPSHLWQQNTMRDALVAAITLDTFNRNAHQVVMANIAQCTNVLQALFLTEGEKMLLTPTYHVFHLYQRHQGARAVRIEIDAPEVSFLAGDQKRAMPCLSGSASIRGDTLTLTLVNAHARHPIDIQVNLPGSAPVPLESLTLHADDIHAHNTFDDPARIAPRSSGIPAASLPPASITAMQYRLS